MTCAPPARDLAFTFTVPGIPVPKARARVNRAGWSFTPKRTMQAENAVRLIATMAQKRTETAFLGPNCEKRLYVCVKLYGARKNADLDNLYKLVTDACQGLLYKNDSQIDCALIYRFDCPKGQERTEVIIQSMEIEP